MSTNIRLTKAFVSIHHTATLKAVVEKLRQHNIAVVVTPQNYISLAEQAEGIDTCTETCVYTKFIEGTAEVDLVITDVHPFEQVQIEQADEQDIFANINIETISLIRAAAKRFDTVTIIPSTDYLANLNRFLTQQNAETSLADRKMLAFEAFNVTSNYDTEINSYLCEGINTKVFKENLVGYKNLRYGENPHQKAVFYGEYDVMFKQLAGNEPSYNNLLDINTAVDILSEFEDPTVVIIKQTNPAGAASRKTIADAWLAAIEYDPLSAYWGCVVCNYPVDKRTATLMRHSGFTIIVAPDFEAEAVEILTKDQDSLMVLRQTSNSIRNTHFRSLLNGVVLQDKDMLKVHVKQGDIVTKRSPGKREFADMNFAHKIVKHSKSNAMVIVKKRQLIVAGTGQTSRVDSLRMAIYRAESLGNELFNAVLASDAHLPFIDSVQIANKAGISAIVQRGGSPNDADMIKYCNKNDIAMVFTNHRHIKH